MTDAEPKTDRYLDALDDVRREAEQHLYTNTKNGNRQALLNIVARLREREAQKGKRHDGR